jgi:hypothetical protein
VTVTEDAMLGWMDAASGRPYIALKGYQGVSGTISIGRYDEGVISGSFNGVAGYWPMGGDPEKDPPSTTIRIADGRFKYSGERFSPRR